MTRMHNPFFVAIVLLACACAAAAFITVSYLYDAMSFPHGPYIVLCMAAFVSVIVAPPEEGQTA